jgi:hypothetical protein
VLIAIVLTCDSVHGDRFLIAERAKLGWPACTAALLSSA